MLAILKCIGVYSEQDQDVSNQPGGPQSPSWYARGQKEADELRVQAEEAAAREAAKTTVRTQMRKESRRGIGLLSVRNVFISDDDQALVYVKPGANAPKKTLPFAAMEAPVVDRTTVTITMRNQPKATSTYKFSAANEDEARKWADALALFVRPQAPKVPSAAAEPAGEIASAA